MKDVTAHCLPRVVHEGGEEGCSVITDLNDSEMGGRINQLPDWTGTSDHHKGLEQQQLDLI